MLRDRSRRQQRPPSFLATVGLRASMACKAIVRCAASRRASASVQPGARPCGLATNGSAPWSMPGSGSADTASTASSPPLASASAALSARVRIARSAAAAVRLRLQPFSARCARSVANVLSAPAPVAEVTGSSCSRLRAACAAGPILFVRSAQQARQHRQPPMQRHQREDLLPLQARPGPARGRRCGARPCHAPACAASRLRRAAALARVALAMTASSCSGCVARSINRRCAAHRSST